MNDRIKAAWPFALIALLAAGLAVQTLRIEGFRAGHITVFGADFWIVDLGGFKPALASCTAERAAIIAAQAEAGRLQASINEDEERRLAANAERSDTAHADDLSRALAASHSFGQRNRIAADGVRPQSDRSAPGAAPAAAESDGAGLSESLPAGAFVAVSDPDLQDCTASVTYAVAAHNWAATIPVDRAASATDLSLRE